MQEGCFLIKAGRVPVAGLEMGALTVRPVPPRRDRAWRELSPPRGRALAGAQEKRASAYAEPLDFLMVPKARLELAQAYAH